MNNKIGILKSIRTKLFLSLCIIVIAIIASLIILNSFVLSGFYEKTKQKKLQDVYETINNYYNDKNTSETISEELDKVAINNNFDILIKDNENISIYSSNKDFYLGMNNVILWGMREEKTFPKKQSNILKTTEKYTISKYREERTNINFMVLMANLDNSYKLFIRMPIASIEESVKISNEFLYIVAIFVIILGGLVLSIVSKRFTKPIVELSKITKNMSNLDFSQKYKTTEENDEIDMLGNNINTLSNKKK